METYDSKSMSYRYLTNNEIDELKKEILAEILQKIDKNLNSINFKRTIYNDMNFMSEVYNKLLKQKEYIENQLQTR
jgi:GTPase SAR1 family protein